MTKKLNRLLTLTIIIAFGFFLGPKINERIPDINQIVQFIKENIPGGNSQKEPDRQLEGPYKVLWVSDGDNICIDYQGKETYVRFIGIDTPESVNPDESKNTPEGKIASDYTKLIISDEVYLEFDVTTRDDYGRLLAYVYLPDGTFLNEKIIRDGYAYTMTIAPNVKYQKTFLEGFEYAKEKKLGLWAEEGD